MTTSARDGGQPGLWPLTETGKKDGKAKPMKREGAATAAPTRQSVASHQNRRSAPVEVANLWCID